MQTAMLSNVECHKNAHFMWCTVKHRHCPAPWLGPHASARQLHDHWQQPGHWDQPIQLSYWCKYLVLKGSTTYYHNFYCAHMQLTVWLVVLCMCSTLFCQFIHWKIYLLRCVTKLRSVPISTIWLYCFLKPRVWWYLIFKNEVVQIILNG